MTENHELTAMCQNCQRTLPANQQATYGGLCEDCFCMKRTHKKHFKNGGDKIHSTRRMRGHGLKVKKVL